MPIKPKSVDEYIANGCGRCEFGGTPKCKTRPWTEELRLLRSVLSESVLTEEIKWSAPCYTHQGKNVVMLGALKECVTVSFFRGAELSDPEGHLEKPGKNSRFARYVRFQDTATIDSMRPIVLGFVEQAIKLEDSGKKAVPSSDSEMEYPEELIQILESDPAFEEAFSGLTPGRQRGYLIYFTSAKQSKTKIARIERSKPKIFEGKGWNER